MNQTYIYITWTISFILSSWVLNIQSLHLWANPSLSNLQWTPSSSTNITFLLLLMVKHWIHGYLAGVILVALQNRDCEVWPWAPSFLLASGCCLGFCCQQQPCGHWTLWSIFPYLNGDCAVGFLADDLDGDLVQTWSIPIIVTAAIMLSIQKFGCSYSISTMWNSLLFANEDLPSLGCSFQHISLAALPLTFFHVLLHQLAKDVDILHVSGHPHSMKYLRKDIKKIWTTWIVFKLKEKH